jgi:hypothetical protein
VSLTFENFEPDQNDWLGMPGWISGREPSQTFHWGMRSLKPGACSLDLRLLKEIYVIF